MSADKKLDPLGKIERRLDGYRSSSEPEPTGIAGVQYRAFIAIRDEILKPYSDAVEELVEAAADLHGLGRWSETDDWDTRWERLGAALARFKQ